MIAEEGAGRGAGFGHAVGVEQDPVVGLELLAADGDGGGRPPGDNQPQWQGGPGVQGAARG